MQILLTGSSIFLICSGGWLWFLRDRGIGIFFGGVGVVFTIANIVKMANGAA